MHTNTNPLSLFHACLNTIDEFADLSYSLSFYLFLYLSCSLLPQVSLSSSCLYLILSAPPSFFLALRFSSLTHTHAHTPSFSLSCMYKYSTLSSRFQTFLYFYKSKISIYHIFSIWHTVFGKPQILCALLY